MFIPACQCPSNNINDPLVMGFRIFQMVSAYYAHLLYLIIMFFVLSPPSLTKHSFGNNLMFSKASN